MLFTFIILKNVYKYLYQLVDLFISFSITDPCPFVIIENILLETYTLTFPPNIYYDHKNPLIKKFYIEYPNQINY